MLCPVCLQPNPDDARWCHFCGSPLVAPPASGADSPEWALPPRTRLHRKGFEIQELLGAGGFGLTYRAVESALGREVAIKEFFPFGSLRDGLEVRPPAGVSVEEWRGELEAFRAEALVLARFNHPAIVRAYAVWTENKTAYFAMEFLRGRSLRQRLDKGAVLPVDEALEVIESIGAALEKVHGAGLLHRDIKPDNILLCDGRAVLIDFGTAREFARDKTTPMTQLLTPGYAPLEQYGKRARFGPFTDVYALGATLYNALSGQAPPPATDRAAGVELRPLDELNPQVPPRLARAIEAALEISVPKRPPTVAAWLQTLHDAQNPPSSPLTEPTSPPVPSAPPPSAPPTIVPSVEPAAPPTASAPSALPSTLEPALPSTSPRVPRREKRAGEEPMEIEVAPDARTPRWVVPTLLLVPLLALTFWWNYDPTRGDLESFDARLQPVLRAHANAQKTFASLDRSSDEAFVADLQARAIPAQQAVVDAIGTLSPSSDEALYSRDQLLDAQRDRLNALQALAQSRQSGGGNVITQLQRADDEMAAWRDDYAYLKRQHRLGN